MPTPKVEDKNQPPSSNRQSKYNFDAMKLNQSMFFPAAEYLAAVVVRAANAWNYRRKNTDSSHRLIWRRQDDEYRGKGLRVWLVSRTAGGSTHEI